MDNDFHQRLLATFRVEAKEHLTALSTALIELENTPGAKHDELFELIFREAHSLKGAARAVNMTGIESLSHALEGVFAACRLQAGVPAPAVFDLLHRAIDEIDTQLLTMEPGDKSAKLRTKELVASLNEAVESAPASGAPPVPPVPEHGESPALEKFAGSGTVRIPTARLDSLLHQGQEMLTAKLALLQRAAELGAIGTALASWENEWKKVRPAVRRLRKVQQAPGAAFTDADAAQLGKLLTFSDWGHAAVKDLEYRVHALAKALAHDRYSLDGMVDTLLDDVKEVLMLPCATVLEVLPKMVRELARDRGKEAQLVIAGESVEIDKRILEEMKDPLIHLVRNCVDHGIERPVERQRLNKPERGTVSVAVSLRDANRVEILVADDGAGIDTVRVAQTVARQGMIAPDEAGRLDRERLLDLVFASGVSTAPLITDISGRGIGLAIVREKVERLGGTVTVTTEPERGTAFRMLLPLTLSTYRGMLVEVRGQTFIIPTASVERVARVPRAGIRTVENRETVEADGMPLSFVWLADVLQLSRREKGGDDAGTIPLFVIGSGVSRIAFGVDAILAEQEILVKGLGPQLSRVRNVAGATVLGNGRVATILHPGDLVKSAVRGAGVPSGVPHPEEHEDIPRKTVLIVEDSVTSRTLLKNILETAGYRTSTAMDGVDALTRLRTEQIDLVVSDVDMPRMNGFELTARIRGSREFAGLPLVLVTSLDSREDRERGVEVGANAYIVKSSFDQSNLLDVLKRLI